MGDIGDISYRPLIEDMVWSYSRIKCFYDCPYRWFLKYIKNIQEKPMFYASYGSFMHKLIEQYYNGVLTKDEMQIKFLFDFPEEVAGERPQDSIVTKYIKDGNRYLAEFKPFDLQKIDVEKKTVFQIGETPFVGYIDFLGEKNGDLYVVDNKSRNLKQRSGRTRQTVNDKLLDDMLRQLYLYSYGVEQEYGKLPKALCFNCFREGTFIEEPFRHEAYEGAIHWAENGVEQIKCEEDFRPHMDYFVCKYLCGVNDECCYWQMR